METPTITTRIADLIRNPHSAMPSEAELSAQKKLPEIPEASTQSSHSVDFSPLAQKILEESGSHESQWDRNRSESIQRVQQLVQEKQYSFSPEIIDGIAHKIVAMLP